MSITTTGPEETGIQYQESDVPMSVGGQPVEVVDADSIDDPTDYDAPEEARVELVPATQGPEKPAEPVNPMVAYVQENLPVNTFDQTVSRFTRQEAEELTGDVLTAFWKVIEAQYELSEVITKAYEGRVWVALGYEAGMKGWKAYCEERITPQAVHLNQAQRHQVIAHMDPDHMPSMRAMAAALNVSERTMRRDAAAVQRDASGKRVHKAVIRGVDGKLYPWDKLRGRDRERAEELVQELHDQGFTEMQIGEKLGGISQPTVNDARRRVARRRIGDGQGGVGPVDVSGVVAGSGDSLDAPDMGFDPMDMAWERNLTNAFEDAAASLDEVCTQLADSHWQPGSPLTGRAMGSSFHDLMSIVGRVTRMLSGLGTDGGGEDDGEPLDDVQVAENLEALIGDDERFSDLVGELEGLRNLLDLILD